MISLSEIGGLYQSIAANQKNARTKAFADACDRQIKKMLECAKKAKVWCALENVDEKYLDYLAADSRAFLYDSSMDPNIKRELILNSQHWNAKMGTCSAMQEILNSVFPENETVIREWFEYGGNPFYFKVTTDADMSEENIVEFIRRISTVKNARSRLDRIEVSRNIGQGLYSCGVCLTEIHLNIGAEDRENVGIQ